MSKFNAERHRIETASALEVVRTADVVERHAAYVGLDVHKETIAVAVAEPGRDEPIYRGEIANKPKTVEKLLAKLSADYDGGLLLFCYEAGPCGYVLYRALLQKIGFGGTSVASVWQYVYGPKGAKLS